MRIFLLPWRHCPLAVRRVNFLVLLLWHTKFALALRRFAAPLFLIEIVFAPLGHFPLLSLPTNFPPFWQRVFFALADGFAAAFFRVTTFFLVLPFLQAPESFGMVLLPVLLLMQTGVEVVVRFRGVAARRFFAAAARFFTEAIVRVEQKLTSLTLMSLPFARVQLALCFARPLRRRTIFGLPLL